MANNLIKARHVEIINKALMKWINDSNKDFSLYGVEDSMFNVHVFYDKEDKDKYYIIIHNSEDDANLEVIKENVNDDSEEE